MKEELINLKTAKLAKEKRFNIETFTAYIGDKFYKSEAEETGYDGFNLAESENWNSKWVYTKNGNGCFGCKLDNVKYFNAYSAPTQSLLQKWIREKLNINISIYNNASGYFWAIMKTEGGSDLGHSDERGDNLESGTFSTYEKALEDILYLILKYSFEEFLNTHFGKHIGNYAYYLNKLENNKLIK